MTGLSVLVASFVVFGTVLAYQIVARTTLDTFSDTPPGVSLVVHTQGGTTLAPQQIAAIRKTSGVAQAVGRVTATFGLGDTSSGSSLDVIADPGSGPLSSITLVTGAYPDGAREIALDRRAAERLGAAPGSTLRLRTGNSGSSPTKVTVTGVVDGAEGDAERAYAPDVVVAALSGDDGYPRLDVLAAPGADVNALQEQFATALSGDRYSYASITTGDAMRVKEAKDAVQQFDQIFALVAMFVAIAVVAAALVATSTFRIVFAQRLRQLALLRTIGAQPGQLVRALAVEGAVVGLLAGTVVGTSSLKAWTDQSLAARTPADLAMFAEDQPISDDVLGRLRDDSRFRDITPFRIANFVSPPETCRTVRSTST